MNDTERINKTNIIPSLPDFDLSNGTISNYFEIFFGGKGACPNWLIYIYLVFFFFGSCVNLIESLLLLRCKKNGILLIILQITLVDSLLFLVAVLEIISSYHQAWIFSSYTCMFFRGTDVLANTLILYLLVCLNFHIITYWNLHNFETEKNKNPLTSFNESSSSECLVTRNETRGLTIDYKKRKTDVSVLFPIILIWLLCISISMPNFVLSSTVEKQGADLCVIIEDFYGTILHSLLLVFSTTVPCFLLLVLLLVMIYKLSKTSQEAIETVLTKKFEEIKRLLIFAIVLTFLYILTSYQRYVFSMNVTIKQLYFFIGSSNNNFPNVYQSMLHYSGTSLRGILCYYMVPNLKEVFNDKLRFCKGKDS